MPHNNRMSTSNSLKTHAIWQTAIGHDPYANDAEKKEEVSEADKEKARNVLAMARSQNLTDGAKRDNFTAQMYQGLKRGKQRRADLSKGAEVADPGLQHLLDDPSSSSEEEFLQTEANLESRKKSSGRGKKKHRKRKKYSSSSGSNASSSDDESSEERRERRVRRKEKRNSKRRKRSSRDYSSSSGDDSDSEDRHRRRKRRRKHEKKKYSRKTER